MTQNPDHEAEYQYQRILAEEMSRLKPANRDSDRTPIANRQIRTARTTTRTWLSAENYFRATLAVLVLITVTCAFISAKSHAITIVTEEMARKWDEENKRKYADEIDAITQRFDDLSKRLRADNYKPTEYERSRQSSDIKRLTEINAERKAVTDFQDRAIAESIVAQIRGTNPGVISVHILAAVAVLILIAILASQRDQFIKSMST